MTINERIRDFRKNIVRMSQQEFADKLGMKQTSVSTFERKGGTVTDPTIKSLCLAFGLNEDWVRYGKDPMNIQPPTFSLDDFIKKRGGTELELEIAKIYFDLEPDFRKTLVQHFSDRLIAYASKKTSVPIPDTPEELEALYPPIDPDTNAG